MRHEPCDEVYSQSAARNLLRLVADLWRAGKLQSNITSCEGNGNCYPVGGCIGVTVRGLVALRTTVLGFAPNRTGPPGKQRPLRMPA